MKDTKETWKNLKQKCGNDEERIKN